MLAQTLNPFTYLVMYLFIKREPPISILDDTPDPLFNPNEVTKVRDILDLHRRGLDVSHVGGLRGEITDERTDLMKLSSPNYESDKLYPSLPRIVEQNAHYSSILTSSQNQLEEKLKQAKQREEMDAKLNDLAKNDPLLQVED